jgi:hypothetical protein
MACRQESRECSVCLVSSGEIMEPYLIKRIKTLLANGWTKQRIIQQLSALGSTKKIEQLIETVSAA